jgi:ABC-type amino acid transport substrate-binding protein
VSCLGGGWRTFGLILALLPGLAGGAAPSSPPRPEAPAVLNIARAQDSATSDRVSAILQRAYARAGLTLRLEPLPAPRASQRLDAGRLDGEVARIAPYFDAHPTLMRVGPPLMQVSLVAYVRSDAGFTVRNVADLRGRRVGIVRGLLQSQRLVAGLDRVTEVTTAVQLYRMLAAGRLDVVLDAPMDQRRHTAQLGLRNVVAQATLCEQPAYHGLHRRHAALAPRLTAALEAMQASGELAALSAGVEPASAPLLATR